MFQNQIGRFKNIKKERVLGCFNISNLVNTKIAKSIKYQAHEGVKSFIIREKIKIGKKEGFVISIFLS